MTSLLTLTLVLPAILCGPVPMPRPDNLLDMTHALEEDIPSFPGHTPYNFTINTRGWWPMKKDIYVELNTILLSEHTATHVDAPSHVGTGKHRDRWRIHQIPDRNWIAPGVVIDFREKVKINPDAEVEIEDLLKYEEKYGRIPQRALVLLYSGWEERWTDRDAYFGGKGVSITNPWKPLHWPGFGLNATKWLVEERNIVGIGSDCISFEKGPQTKTLDVHKYLLEEKSLLGYEMVANVSRVPPAGATIYAFPLKIYDGSGAPVRMFAMWNNAAAGLEMSAILTTTILLIFILLK